MSHEQPPLPDYDRLTVGDLQHRIRSLDEGRLRAVLDYECRHANRPQLIDVLMARQVQLADGAEPAPGDQKDVPAPADSAGGSPARPDSGAEPGTPLRHGVSEQTPRRGR